MDQYTIEHEPKNTVTILYTIPWKEIKSSYGETFDEMRKKIELKGFRKGSVPASVAEKHISKQSVYENLLNKILSKKYSEVVKKENLQPISNPRIELTSAEDEKDWTVQIRIGVRPDIKDEDIKKALSQAKSQSKSETIWVPGKDKEKPNEEQQKRKRLDIAIKTLMEGLKVEISDILIEEELSKKLAQLVDDIRRVGLTMESYLSSKGLTMEQLREQYKKEINNAYVLEVILQEVAEHKKIQVTDADLDEFIDTIKDDKEKKEAKGNSYLYASFLRKQKTLEYLSSL